MNIADGFAPFVHIYASACPDPTLLHHARLACIEWFAGTLAWEVELDAIEADGSTVSFAIPVPAGSVVHKLVKVTAQQTNTAIEDAEVLEAKDGRARIGDQCARLLAFTDPARTSLTVYPAQPVDTAIRVTAALKPSLAAVELPDGLFEQFADAISDGVIGRLLGMSNVDWRDEKTAAHHLDKFQAAMNTQARFAERGFARNKRRSETKWF